MEKRRRGRPKKDTMRRQSKPSSIVPVSHPERVSLDDKCSISWEVFVSSMQAANNANNFIPLSNNVYRKQLTDKLENRYVPPTKDEQDTYPPII